MNYHSIMPVRRILLFQTLTIKKLINLYPDALRYPDRHGSFIFHVNFAADLSHSINFYDVPLNEIMSQRDCPLKTIEIVRFLMDHHPTLIQQIDTHDEYPLHRVFAQNSFDER
jgi:hypothetical protein